MVVVVAAAVAAAAAASAAARPAGMADDSLKRAIIYKAPARGDPLRAVCGRSIAALLRCHHNCGRGIIVVIIFVLAVFISTEPRLRPVWGALPAELSRRSGKKGRGAPVKLGLDWAVK